MRLMRHKSGFGGLPRGRRAGRGLAELDVLVEALEQRQLLAGNVEVAVVGGTLVISGDGQDNHVLVDQASAVNPQEYRVTAPGGTINGLAGEQVFGGVTKDIRVSLHDGSDLLTLSALQARDVHFDGGEGDNSLTLGHTDLRNVRVTNGDGYDTITLQSVAIGNNLVIRNGSGGSETAVEEQGAASPGEFLSSVGGRFSVFNDVGLDRVGIYFAEIGGPLNLRDGQGFFDVRMQHFDVDGPTTIRAGADDEYFAVADGDLDSLRLLGGSGYLDFELTRVDVRANALAMSSGPEATVSGSLAELGIGGNVRFSNANHVSVFQVDVAGHLQIRSNQASYDGEIGHSTIAGRTSINTMGGNDELTIYSSRFDGPFSLRTGGGVDEIYMQDSAGALPLSFQASLRVALGSGNDVLWFGPANLTSRPLETFGLVRLDGGAGNDTWDHLNHVNNYFGALPTIQGFENTQ